MALHMNGHTTNCLVFRKSYHFWLAKMNEIAAKAEENSRSLACGFWPSNKKKTAMSGEQQKRSKCLYGKSVKVRRNR